VDAVQMGTDTSAGLHHSRKPAIIVPEQQTNSVLQEELQIRFAP
jgi:hypothetical protein